MHPKQHNVQNVPLAAKEKVSLSPPHDKLGVFKQFMKSLKPNENRASLRFLKKTFQALSEAKTIEGGLVSPRIQKVVFNDDLSSLPGSLSKTSCAPFLCKHCTNNYQESIANLIQKYHEIVRSMTLKLHLDLFHERFFFVSDEQSERFHQDIAVLKRRYKA